MMKKVFLLMVVAIWTTAMYAQDYRMQSTSMYNSQATNAPTNTNVTAPGAAVPAAMYSTTYDAYSASSSNIRKLGGVTEDEEERSEESPIGGALLPLALMAAAYGVSRVRRKE